MKTCISVVVAEDYVGFYPISEHLIRDGKIQNIKKPRSVPELLSVRDTRLISVTQIINGTTMFYIEWS